MLKEINKPLYKTRNYCEIVTINYDTCEVDYDPTGLEDLLPVEKLNEKLSEKKYTNIRQKLIEKRGLFLAVVQKFCDIVKSRLNEYKNSPALIKNIAQYPQRFQNARLKQKTNLEKTLDDLDKLKKSLNSNTEDVTQVKRKISNLKKDITKIKDTLMGLKIMDITMKEILVEDFGLMTCKTVNNAIASFVAIYKRIYERVLLLAGVDHPKRKFREKLQNKILDIKHDVNFTKSILDRIESSKTKNDLGYWVNKLSYIIGSEAAQINPNELALTSLAAEVDEISGGLKKDIQTGLDGLKSKMTGTKKSCEVINLNGITLECDLKSACDRIAGIEGMTPALQKVCRMKLCCDVLELGDDADGSLYAGVWKDHGKEFSVLSGLEEGLMRVGETFEYICAALCVVSQVCYVNVAAISLFPVPTLHMVLVLYPIITVCLALLPIGLGKIFKHIRGKIHKEGQEYILKPGRKILLGKDKKKDN